jgi:Arc/MetJ family transcription regulator
LLLESLQNGIFCVDITHKESMMATNLALDDSLLNQAMDIGHLRTKRETVSIALKEFIERRRQKKILDLQGKIVFREDWDYKKDRRDRESAR